ncbi:lipid droplet-associated hydrolase-like [Lineus longissimus]|uniref:lipid droplet-associated hydrolase-like n=1 Tax=Lineus longissimus TaxID=88925 RepID=UPI002B4F65E6
METEEIETRSEFAFVCGVPTHVLKYGQLGDNDTLILVIPGNPGIIGFYELFMDTLNQLSDYSIPVWGVSHAGHVTVPPHITYSEPPFDIYTLKGQIHHKVEFIRRYIPSTTKLIIISHSIGGYISLEIMKRLPERTFLKSILLFPTIERMAESPHGQIATPLLKYLRWFAFLIVLLLSYLSPILKYRMITYYFQGRRIAECAFNAAMNLFDPVCTSNCMYMAMTEMADVKEPDLATIETNMSKLTFYYGTIDHWCPISYYQDMQKVFPNADLHLCEHGFEHAYVLESSVEMATIVWGMVRKVVRQAEKKRIG